MHARRFHWGSRMFTRARLKGSLGLVWVHSDATWDRRFHSYSRWFTTARAGFILVCLLSLGLTHSGSRGFTPAVSCVDCGGPMGRRVHSGSRVFPRAPLVVVGFIHVRSFRFTRMA